MPNIRDTTGGYTAYPFVAEFYDHVVPYRNRDDVRFYVETAERVGGRVLELGCGTGRVLIPTARAGIDVLGLDLSNAMLDQCRRALANESDGTRSRIRLVEGDMRSFDLGEHFNLITIPFRAFQHLLTVEDQLACLASVRRHLADGGIFVLDIYNPSIPRMADNSTEETGAEPEFVMADGRRIIRRHRIARRDLHAQILDIELIYDVTHPDARQERLIHQFPMRFLFRFEVEHLLARSGFTVETVLADYSGAPYGTTYPGELLTIARTA